MTIEERDAELFKEFIEVYQGNLKVTITHPLQYVLRLETRRRDVDFERLGQET